MDPAYIHHSSTVVPFADQVNVLDGEPIAAPAAGLVIAGDPLAGDEVTKKVTAKQVEMEWKCVLLLLHQLTPEHPVVSVFFPASGLVLSPTPL